MKLHVVVLVTLSCCVLAYTNCNEKALQYVKRPVYKFSIQLLQRVAEDTQSNFVFSPLTTWLQLSALAEGATNETYREIQQVTRTPRPKCFKKKLREILYKLNRNSKYESRRKSIIAIDKLLAVKKLFIREAKRLYGVDVLLLDFYRPEKSSFKVNKEVYDATGGTIDHILYDSDFNSTVLLMSDANYFHSDWLKPFNSAYTTTREFYGISGGVIGEVSMMQQTDYFNMVEIEIINAKVLEIPFVRDKICMLVFLPTTDTWVGEIFYSLERTRIRGIFNLFKRAGKKLLNVAIPKFDLQTELQNLPELLYDMGIKRVFGPDIAELKGISRYPTYASLMTQISHIEVNEGGVSISSSNMIKENSDVESFYVDKPFVYMIVDKSTEFILYAGMYTSPDKSYTSDKNVGFRV